MLNLGSGSAKRATDPFAGFPSSGLVALYKCDEREGDRLKDAVGNLPDMVLSTGVAFDSVAADCYFNDTTGLLAAVVGQPAVLIMGCEIITPAAVGSANENFVIGRATSTHNSPFYLNISEITTTSKFRVYANVRTIRDGTATADTTFNSSASLVLNPSTHYQIVVRIDMGAATPTAEFAVRSGASGVWTGYKTTGGTAGTHLFASSVAFRLLARDSASDPWNGKTMAVFAGAVDVPMSTAKLILGRAGKTNIRNILGTTKSRFWDFKGGTGASVRELCTDTTETITGTTAWSTSLTGCSQIALRQGNGYYGRAGIKIGGEASFAPTGGGAVSAASPSQILSSDAGWTFQMTAKVGSRDPASATQLLAYVFGPDSTGAAITDPADQTGAGFVLDTSQNIAARAKRIGATDASDAISAVIGKGSNNPANGLLTTYTLTCSSNGTNWIVKGYRQTIEDSEPVEITPSATWSTQDYHITRANAVRIGNASFDGEATVGFVGIWHRPITAAEMAQCHLSAVARMDGEEIHVAAASGLYGNGSENYPFKTLLPAWRTMQPGQIIRLGAGTYTDRIDAGNLNIGPTTEDNISVYGSGIATTIIMGGASDLENPAAVNGGSWYFSDLKFDANNTSTSAFTTELQNDVASLIFERVHFYNAKVGVSSGTGLVVRTKYLRMLDCESSSNGEHGVYLRIASEDEGNRRAVIDGLYCHDNTEDGLKFAADTTSPNMEERVTWDSCIVNRLKVDGGRRQLWIAGVSNSVFTNILLLNGENPDTTAPGALRLGHPAGAETDADTEDGCWNNTIANITIVGTTGIAIHDARSEGTTIRNLICSGCGDDLTRGTDGTAVITYAAGDADSNKLPVHATNIIDADIVFTNAGAGDYTLTALSDGYGDGVNLTGLSDEVESDYAGTARPSTGAWDMGALQHVEV